MQQSEFNTGEEMSRRVQRQIILGFVLAALLAPPALYFTYSIVRQTIDAVDWTIHTGEVLAELTELSIIVAEGRIEQIHPQVQKIKYLTKDNTNQQFNLDRVEMAVIRGSGVEYEIRTARLEEIRLLQERTARGRSNITPTIGLIGGFVLLSISLGAVAVWMSIRNDRRRQKIIQDLSNAKKTLERQLNIREELADTEAIAAVQDAREAIQSIILRVSGEHQLV